ncbi:hypothetical protein NHH03_25315 [Stieleria sp. TO1_6]|uniref:hypothetical protein n=1 Tax=Stieleria tagensis TaxID=2956795 RepID=UPI00209AFAA3|nr:hypothetical protein [Stieleria tagensis]MCO8125080.1 hypothetical protein [Stieleria tagensis]
MFRTILILAVMGGGAFMAGWFTIDRNADETTIRFNREEIRADTNKAIAKGRELLNEVESKDSTDAESHQMFPNLHLPESGDAAQQAHLSLPHWENPINQTPAAPSQQY